ncbi:MAG: hypothetical protein EBZ91_10160 [Gammaproteobacteria bacterium]|nr:hypothetical protein [Gammaproteobacteria bacterium]
MRYQAEREAEQEAANRRRWLTVHADHYARVCPVCGAEPETFCRDEEDGEEVYVVHRQRIPEGQPFRLRTRLVRDISAEVREEEPCAGGS